MQAVIDLHAASAACRARDPGGRGPASTCWSRSRWRRASRDCDAMLAAAREAGVKLGVISQRRWYEPVRRMKDAPSTPARSAAPRSASSRCISWRDAAYYRSDPWRGRWDTEGGRRARQPVPAPARPPAVVHGRRPRRSAATGPTSTTRRSRSRTPPWPPSASGAAASARSSTSVSQRPGLYTKVHVHGSNGASVGVETDRGATFIAGVSAIAEPPLNDLWTIPGEEGRLAEFQAEDRAPFPADRRHHPLPRAADPGLPRGHPRGPPAAGHRRGRSRGRRHVHGDLSLASRAQADPIPPAGRVRGEPSDRVGPGSDQFPNRLRKRPKKPRRDPFARAGFSG